MSQKDEFIIGMVAGGIIWLFFIANGGTVPQGSPAPIDPFLTFFADDVNMLKSFLFYVLIGGILSTVLTPVIQRFKRR